MRVVHAIRSDSFAGVERHVLVLVRALKARGHEVAVVGGEPGWMAPGLSNVGPWLPGASVREVVCSLNRLGRPDIVHAHMTAAEIAASAAHVMWGVPLVSTRHFGARRGGTPAGRAAAPLLRHRVTAQIAVSAYVADRIDGPATTILAGLATDSAPCPPSAARQRVVLVAQRLEREKNTETALEAFAHSGLSKEGWRLRVAGTGAQGPELEALSRALGVGEAVEFLGRRRDVPSLMRESSILVATSPAEHFGLTVIEAMAEGLPVVATGAAGHLETIGRVAGARLFRPGDAAGAAQHLRELAGDVEARQSYAARQQAVQEAHFTAERQAAEVEGVYLECLQ